MHVQAAALNSLINILQVACSLLTAAAAWLQETQWHVPEAGFVPMPGADAWLPGNCEAAALAADNSAGAPAAVTRTCAAPAACPGAGAPELLVRPASDALPIADSRAHNLHARVCSNGSSRSAEAAAAAAGAEEACSAIAEPIDAGFARHDGTASRGGCTPSGSPASRSAGEPGDRSAEAQTGSFPAHHAEAAGPTAAEGKCGFGSAGNGSDGAPLLMRHHGDRGPAPRRETTGFLLQDWGIRPAHAHIHFDSDPDSGPDPGPGPGPGPAAGALEGLCFGLDLGLGTPGAATAMAAVASGGDALDMDAGDAGGPTEGAAAADTALAAVAAVTERVAEMEAGARAGRAGPAALTTHAGGASAGRATVRWPSASQRAMLEARAARRKPSVDVQGW